jgi:ferrous iron transport protein B
MYIRKAGTVILAVSLVMWALMYFPRLDPPPPEGQAVGVDTHRPSRGKEVGETEYDKGQAQLRQSIAGRMGTALLPLSRWAGFDWRDNVALIGGFAAKEVVVGTLGVAYSMGDVHPEKSESLSSRLAAEEGWSPLRAMSMLIFVMIYAPCMTTLAVIRREAGSWKWALFSTAYTTCLAFLLAVGIYQIGGALGLGG